MQRRFSFSWFSSFAQWLFRVAWPQVLRVLLHVLSEIFILITGNKVYTCCDGGFPTRDYCFPAAVVVVVSPAAIFAGGESIERIEANPIAKIMGVINECSQAFVIGLCPYW